MNIDIDSLTKIMQKATPGPWEAKHTDRHHFVIQSLAQGANEGGVVAKTGTPLSATTEMIEANASLLAMAPELVNEIIRLRGVISEVADLVECGFPLSSNDLFATITTVKEEDND